MIAGKSVALRSIEEADLEQMRKWRNTESLRRYFREYREITVEMQRAWYETRVKPDNDQIDFAIVSHGPGKWPPDRLLGYCGLSKISKTDRHAEFGIYVGDQENRGKGYGSEALELLMKFGFEELNLNRIWCEVYEFNTAVQSYKRLGFKTEGILRQHHFTEGRYFNSIMMGMLQSEWFQRWQNR